MSVAKDTERAKWDVVNSRYCQECDRSWAGSDSSKVQKYFGIIKSSILVYLNYPSTRFPLPTRLNITHEFYHQALSPPANLPPLNSWYLILPVPD